MAVQLVVEWVEKIIQKQNVTNEQVKGMVPQHENKTH
jgi:hypothetical protein